MESYTSKLITMKKLIQLLLFTILSVSAYAQVGPSHLNIKLIPGFDSTSTQVIKNGRVRYDSTSQKFRFRQNGEWVGLGSGGSGAGLVDADYGDITVSGTGTVMTIDNGVITGAKLGAISSAQLATALSDESGSGTVVFSSYADAKVADAINNGTTTIAPSQNAVYDALNTGVVNTFTSDHVLALTDITNLKGHVRMNLTSTGNNVTVPPNSMVAFPIGTEISLIQVGTGVTTVVEGSGVTITPPAGGSLVSPGQGQPMVLKKISTDGWELYNGNAPSALTKTDDTNVTLTLGGSPTLALLAPTSITVGWAGILSTTRGGTGVSTPSGTYTPTLTNTANLSASTAYLCTWSRVGSTVTVAGRVDIDPTTTATLTTLGVSLPVASNFSSTDQAGGTAAANSVADATAGILSYATNDRVTLQYICTDVTNHSMYFTFSYQVL
jgi:hypothetical protein